MGREMGENPWTDSRFESLQENVTAITVNFKTPDLLESCVKSFLRYYPDLPYVLIDNGGSPESLDCIQKLASEFSSIRSILNEGNIGHGPALNQGFELAETRYVFTLDSDTKTKQADFLEEMLARFEDDELFALGWLRWVNESGVAYKDQTKQEGYPYIHPYAALFDRGKLLELSGFANTGAPAARLMREAVARDYRLESYPVSDSIWHKISGTRGRFQGRCWVPTSSQPANWKKYKI